MVRVSYTNPLDVHIGDNTIGGSHFGDEIFYVFSLRIEGDPRISEVYSQKWRHQLKLVLELVSDLLPALI